MTAHPLKLSEIEQAIKNLDSDKQRKLLIRLPRLLKLEVVDLELLKLAEKSFEFWNNKEDSIYDTF